MSEETTIGAFLPGVEEYQKNNLLRQLGMAHITSVRGQRILDIGGNGDLSFAKTLYEWSGVKVTVVNPTPEEVNPDAIDDHRIQFIRSGAEETGLPNESFDLIYGGAVLEHVVAYAQMFRECFRLLRPGGKVLLNGGPLWHSRIGHHVFVVKGSMDYRFNGNNPVPDFGHLHLSRQEMDLELAKRDIPALHREAIIRMIYEEGSINRALTEDILAAVNSLPWERVSVETDGKDQLPDRAVLSRIPATRAGRGTSIFAINVYIVAAKPRSSRRVGVTGKISVLIQAILHGDRAAQHQVLRAIYHRFPLPSAAKERLRSWRAAPHSTVERRATTITAPTPAVDTGGLVTSVEGVAVDWTPAFEYSRLREEEISEYSNIEVTQSLREGGRHAHKAWEFWFQYVARKWNTGLHPEILEICKGLENPQILSLGCGYAGIEIDIAQVLRPPYQIVALDINPGVLARPRAVAREKSLNIRFAALDLNFVQIAERSFDVIFAHASLHHLLNLEHVFLQIYRGLKDHGRLVVQDIIGQTQVLFWKENVDFAISLIDQMPARYGQGIHLARYVEPSVQIGMEGIRQEEIETLLLKFFQPDKMYKYGSFMRMICTHPELGRRFDPDVAEDKAYLEGLCELDLTQIEQGKLRPTEMLAVLKKKEAVDFDLIFRDAHEQLAALFERRGHHANASRHEAAAQSINSGRR